MTDSIRVQSEDFDVAAAYRALSEGDVQSGGIAVFVGRVRADNDRDPVVALELEHYPAMTEKSLTELVAQARERWALGRVAVVHRIGYLPVGEQIVLVGASAGHRREAFAAAEFLMDQLKTTAPFWKKEHRQSGASAWVEARSRDFQAASRWQ